MSRLDEALNRAAGEQPSGLQPDAAAAAEVDLAAFPAETPAPGAPVADEFRAEPSLAVGTEPATPLVAPEIDPEPPAAAVDGDRKWGTYNFGVIVSHKVVVDHQVDASLVEQYRRLAASLHHAQLKRGIRTVMITSAIASEGKTLTATNLALTLSHSYRRRVLLIDADLRRPTVHEVFRIENHTGLDEILKNPSIRQLPIVQLSSTLWVLTAGKPDPDPMGGLSSEQMKTLLSEAGEHFDWVIVDTPPVAVLSDANLLAASIDAALVVIGANKTPYPLVKRAIESLGQERVLGVILNRIEKSELVGGYGYDGYYGYHYGYGASQDSGGAGASLSPVEVPQTS